MANSSPPMRATADCPDPLRRELLRTLALSRPATSMSISSPAACPRLSLISLNPSRSTNRTANRPPCWLCRLDRGLEAVDEIEAVWDMRERIGDLALGDVGLRTRHAERFARRIADRNPAAQRPDVAAGFVAHAVLADELRSLALAVRGNLVADTLPVVGVNVGEPFLGAATSFRSPSSRA